MKVVAKGSGLSASLWNGASEIPFTSAAWDGKTLTLELAHYDAKVVAERKGEGLEGGYMRVIATGLAEVPFRASRKATAVPAPKGGASLDGSWGVEMGDGRSIEKMTGVFRQKGGAVTGTFLSTTGDYGALHGTFDGERLVLSVFDGVHVYRFDAELLRTAASPANTVRARIRPSRGARRRLDAAAAATFLPGSFDIVKPKDPSRPYVVSFPDVEGRIVSTADARFAGKPMLVAFMGTWCPNCADEAPFLRDLEKKYGPQGSRDRLAVVRIHGRRRAQPPPGEEVRRALRNEASDPPRGHDERRPCLARDPPAGGLGGLSDDALPRPQPPHREDPLRLRRPGDGRAVHESEKGARERGRDALENDELGGRARVLNVRLKNFDLIDRQLRVIGP